jgi:apolipoprotein N-acyltransferase
LTRLGSNLSNILRSNLTNSTNWLSLIAGLSLVLAYAPFSQWWLAIVAPAIWLAKINQLNVRMATKQGFIFGLAWFSSGISWVHVSIDQFGGLPLLVSLLLMLLLCVYLALYPAVACYLSARFNPKRQFTLWLFPAFWLIAETARGALLTGFPWLSLGYSQIDGPLAAFAPVIGETGITFVMLCLSICLVNIVCARQLKRHIALLTLILVAAAALNQISWLQLKQRVVKTALIQGNIKQEMKWVPEQEWPTMLKYLDLTQQNFDAQLIIWPENAVPEIEPAAQDYLSMVDKDASLNNTAIITGIINYNVVTKDYYNSLIVLGNKQQHKQEKQVRQQGDYFYGSSNRYYKNHLLPIGEFVPFQSLLRPLAPLFNLPQSSFSRGPYVQKNLVAAGLNIAPLICFEIAFPEQLAANFTDSTDILLTVSNDAWFGDSHGPHQHLEIARMRALEFGRPLLRSTNNGITAIVDHKGKVTGTIPQFEEAVLRADVQLVSGTTPYSYLAGVIRWLLPFLLLSGYYLSTRRKKRL